MREKIRDGKMGRSLRGTKHKWTLISQKNEE